MNESEKNERRKKRAQTLVKDVVQAGYEDPVLIRKLLGLAFESKDQVWTRRNSYAFLLKAGVHNERAWALSGMNELSISSG
jgi:hypothetical protein